jgi:hypothetical protein
LGNVLHLAHLAQELEISTQALSSRYIGGIAGRSSPASIAQLSTAAAACSASSLSLMRDLVPLDLEQQAAIADLQQSGGLTAVPPRVPERPLDRVDLGPSSQSSQSEDVSLVRTRGKIRLSRYLGRALQAIRRCNGFLDVFHRNFY